ncbi:MAG: hypothetical protein VYE22_40040 [Myxococcota bacterium]|nr:hypothetical protein [Myxococcota bacterium]
MHVERVGGPGPTLELAYERAPAPLVRAFAAQLQARWDAGERFAAGDGLVLGMMRMRVVDAGSERLTVETPGHGRSVDAPILLAARQRYLCESLEVPPQPSVPGPDQTFRACGRWTTHPQLELEREQGGGTDSGWRLRCGDPVHDQSDLGVHGWEALWAHRPGLAVALGLPPGFRVLCTPAPTYFRYQGVAIPLEPGSFGRELVDRSQRPDDEVLQRIEAEPELLEAAQRRDVEAEVRAVRVLSIRYGVSESLVGEVFRRVQASSRGEARRTALDDPKLRRKIARALEGGRRGAAVRLLMNALGLSARDAEAALRELE